ncbi:undecaprenyl-diphosphate phosphatase [Gordonia liuliyuniae]|uniref:Undecaprenyl-diphosphatase n=1 Tax=Gordonia liuliyuniae TaxID=2911517 RepID=A0ABS9IQW9_9ACTN|nr:undecaprenyl-diphosphate phosphatase [Gordonia liuliyuniae]MCF8587922.1 undecaprenyl-diphosphate phosphatase [Gordonia liuliyuniae]
MIESMSWLQAVVLGALQGVTEFLPISSSGHLRIVSQIWFGQDAGASFTAVTQLGTELAVLLYFAKDIGRIVVAWFAGLRDSSRRDLDYRLGWYVILATIPIGLLGYLLKDEIRTAGRNLWLVAIMLIAFSFVFLAAEITAAQRPGKSLEQMRPRDALAMGIAQCLALIPGVSRSGGTASAGLFFGMKREAAFRFSFLIAIPAVLASGLFSLPDAFNPDGSGVSASGPQILVATFIAFVLGYVSIAWLLKFVSGHSLAWFAGYRIALGLLVLILLTAGVITT